MGVVTSAGQRRTLLQQKFIRLGFEALEEKEGIRLLFSLCRYRPACDQCIEGCVKDFGSLRRLVSASTEELERAGVCDRGLVVIRLIRELPEEVLKELKKIEASWLKRVGLTGYPKRE